MWLKPVVLKTVVLAWVPGDRSHFLDTIGKLISNALAWFMGVISSIPWLEVIKTLSSVAMAVIAFFALKNWQRQDRAKREAEFLDALIDSTHTYIAEFAKTFEFFKIVKIGMECHEPTWENNLQEDIAVKGAIAYINKDGEYAAKRLLEMLAVVQNSVIQLRSLVVKGQIFNFTDYTKCLNAATILTWHFDRIVSFTTLIGSRTWNWENQEVLKLLKKMMAIDPDEIQKSIQENNALLIEFAQDTYKQIYGRKMKNNK